MGRQDNQSCGNIPESASYANTTRVSAIGGKTIMYGGEGGTGDYVASSMLINKGFRRTCDRWALNFAHYARIYKKADLGWIGHSGFGGYNRVSWHQHAKAWDVNFIRFADGTYMDMYRPKRSWDSPRLDQRRLYLAVNASLRRYFTGHIDAYADKDEHYNHIHVDSSCPARTPYVRWGRRSDDAEFIQQLVWNFTGRRIRTDGVWRRETLNGWLLLLRRLHMNRKNPLGSGAVWNTFLAYIMMHGLANKAAGYWIYPD